MTDFKDHFLCRSRFNCPEYDNGCSNQVGTCMHIGDCEVCTNSGENTCFECEHFENNKDGGYYEEW